MKSLPAVFVQFGVYHSRSKRTDTTFTVIYSVSPAELETEMKKCLGNLNRLSIKNQYGS